ncbi:uncharacterized protein LOC127081611 [Lathyrus oleraceus]|uniref:uncharacterized protein LOC127081611 n=1 Tax=Pisum sativum TaxID=3888 RepID=UPI0021D157C0|nr:uncharacterized protein LOC127081611 [Pisum sativum]
MNGVVEAANKNIKKIVQKMVVTYKDSHEMLPFALHGYHTSVRTSTGTTPFSLVYGMEAVLPVEVEFPSLRLLTDVELDEAEWVQNRLDQLNLIEEKKMTAICHGQLYQKRMKTAFDRKVRPQSYQSWQEYLAVSADSTRFKQKTVFYCKYEIHNFCSEDCSAMVLYPSIPYQIILRFICGGRRLIP